MNETVLSHALYRLSEYLYLFSILCFSFFFLSIFYLLLFLSPFSLASGNKKACFDQKQNPSRTGSTDYE